jgi:hypothetical protein
VNSTADLWGRFSKECVDSNVVYLSIPNLPLGYTFSPEDVERMIALAESNPKVLFVMDEAYAEWSFCRNRWVSSRCANIVTVRTMSKAFAAAGIRVGYVMCHKTIGSELRKHACTKSITTSSIAIALAIMQDRAEYISAARQQLDLWKVFVSDVHHLHGSEGVLSPWWTGVEWSGCVPFVLLKTYTDANSAYVEQFFKFHGVLVRDKGKDVGYPCVRICLADQSGLSVVLNILKMLTVDTSARLWDSFDHLYVDIDKTIRKCYHSSIPKKLVYMLNTVGKRMKLHFVTDNRASHQQVSSYLNHQGVNYSSLTTPAKTIGIDITATEYSQGYKIMADCVVLFKFPHVSPQLMSAIHKTRHIKVIETDMYEDAAEVGGSGKYGDVEVPFVGQFLTCVRHTFKLGVFGKSVVHINRPKGERAIMIGDSESDWMFARNNGMMFWKVGCPDDTAAFLSKLC